MEGSDRFRARQLGSYYLLYAIVKFVRRFGEMAMLERQEGIIRKRNVWGLKKTCFPLFGSGLNPASLENNGRAISGNAS